MYLFGSIDEQKKEGESTGNDGCFLERPGVNIAEDIRKCGGTRFFFPSVPACFSQVFDCFEIFFPLQPPNYPAENRGEQPNSFVQLLIAYIRVVMWGEKMQTRASKIKLC
jgi:hypothetical protein